MNQFDKIYESLLNRVNESGVFKGPSKKEVSKRTEEAEKRNEAALKPLIANMFKSMNNYEYGDIVIPGRDHYKHAIEFAYTAMEEDIPLGKKDTELAADAIYKQNIQRLADVLKDKDLDTVTEVIDYIIQEINSAEDPDADDDY